MHRHWAAVAVAARGGATAAPARAGMPENGGEMTLGQLRRIDAASEEDCPDSLENTLENTPAAVVVSTGKDIHRTGARSSLDALRLAPGSNVARVTTGSWSISSRGVNGRFADKLTMPGDGRTACTVLLAGGYRNRPDTFPEDVGRTLVIHDGDAVPMGRLARRPVPDIEPTVTGRNLLPGAHLEPGGDAVAGTISTKAEHSVFGSVAPKT